MDIPNKQGVVLRVCVYVDLIYPGQFPENSAVFRPIFSLSLSLSFSADLFPSLLLSISLSGPVSLLPPLFLSLSVPYLSAFRLCAL